MEKLQIRDDRCRGCELCISACPKGILALDTQKLTAKGYNPVYLTDNDACISCAICAKICPDCAITVFKGE